MHQLTHVLDNQVDDVELLLLRLTTVRLLMASGQHRLVERGLHEVEAAFVGFDDSIRAGRAILDDAGHESLQHAVAAADPELAIELERRAARLRTLERDLRVLMTNTSQAAQLGLRAAATIDLSGGTARVEPAATTRGFLTGQV